MCNCPDVQFGEVDIVSSCIHGQASQTGAGEVFHTASMGDMEIEISHETEMADLITQDTSNVSDFLDGLNNLLNSI